MDRSINEFLPDNSAPEDVEYQLILKEDAQRLLKDRKPFSHKGTYGHALIIAGAPETMGAAILSASACLHGGAGLTTAAIPESGLSALNTSLPEVMYASRESLLNAGILDRYNAIVVGPGLKQVDGYSAVDLGIIELLLSRAQPILADADALNLFSEKPAYLRTLPKGSILTPHVKEFDRLFGTHDTWWERLLFARDFAKSNGVVIVLKNQYTFVVPPNGTIYINTTGSPAMAQGGMGDVLSGLICAFVAQGYEAQDAAIIGCYLHGLAGDDLAQESFNVTASKLALQVPKSRFQLQSSAPS